MSDTCNCIACGKPMKNYQDDGTLQPSGGLAFQTQGHYGSAVFDPMDGSLLEIAVCDDCIGRASRRNEVVLVDNKGVRANPAPANAPLLIGEPEMSSAGVEIMNLAHRLKDNPDFAAEVERIRTIGAWISMGRMSDGERAMIQMLGTMVGQMRERGLEFDDNKPIVPQIVKFFDDLSAKASDA